MSIESKATIRLDTEADTTGASKATKAVKGLNVEAVNMASYMTVASGVLSGVGAVLSTVGDIGSKVIGMLDSLATQAGVLERVTIRLTGAMERAGASEESMARSGWAIEIMAARTGQATDDLSVQLATLTDLAGSAEAGTVTLARAMDLAAGSGEDQQKAVDAIRSSYTGEIGQLKKLMPQRAEEIKKLTSITDNNERLQAVLAMVNEEYGGASKSLNKGVASWMTLKNTMGDAVEVMGTAVFSNALVADGLEFVAQMGRAALMTFDSFVGVLGTATGASSTFKDAQFSSVKAIGYLGDVMNFVGPIIMGIITQVRLFMNTLELAFSAVALVMGNVARNAVAAFKFILNGALATITALADFAAIVDEDFAASLRSVADPLKKVATGLDEVDSKLQGFTDGALANLKDGLGGYKRIVTDGQNAQIRWNIATMEMIGNMLVLQAGMDESAVAIDGETEAIKRGNTALAERGRLLEMTRGGLGGMVQGAVKRQAGATGSAVGGLISQSYSGRSLASEGEKAGIGSAAAGIGQHGAKADRLSGTVSAATQLTSELGLVNSELGVVEGGIASLVGSAKAGFGELVSGALSAGGGFQEAIGGAVSNMAQVFSKFFFSTAAGLLALQTMNPAAAFLAAAALAAMQGFVSSLFSGGGGGQQGQTASASLHKGNAPIQAALKDREQKTQGGQTYIMMGPLIDREKAARVVYDLNLEGERAYS